MSENDLGCQAGSSAAREDGVAASAALHPGDGDGAKSWRERAKALSDAAWMAVREIAQGSFVDTSTPAGKLSEMVMEMAVHLGQAGKVIHDLEAASSKSQIEEPALAGDEVSAASQSASLTPPNQDFEAKARAIVERASNQPVELITAISSTLLTASKDATERAARIADSYADRILAEGESIIGDTISKTASAIASAIRTQES